jgi:ribosomal protein S27E
MALGDADLIRIFEAGETGGVAAKAEALLAALRPDLDDEARGKIGLGDRDRLFWAFKTDLFSRGTQMLAKVKCHNCDEWNSLDLGATFDMPPKTSDEVRVAYAGKDWTLRLPAQGDLAHLTPEGFPYHRLNAQAPWGEPDFRKAAEVAIDAADPAIDVVIDVHCPDCGATTPCAFDAVTFLWSDIEACALRVFSDIATLARAFGWSESETLGLTARRRARYVEMVS